MSTRSYYKLISTVVAEKHGRKGRPKGIANKCYNCKMLLIKNMPTRIRTIAYLNERDCGIYLYKLTARLADDSRTKTWAGITCTETLQSSKIRLSF